MGKLPDRAVMTLPAALSALQIGLFILVVWVPVAAAGANVSQWAVRGLLGADCR